MRNIFLGLLLANLGFLAWQYWFAPPEPAPPPGEREFGDVTLASEFDGVPPGVELATVRIEAPDAVPPGNSADGEAALTEGPDVEFLDATAERPAGDEVRVAVADTAATPDDSAAAAGAEPATPVADDVAVNELAAGVTDAAFAELVCVSIGPFRELSQVSVAASSLRETGIEPRQRAGEGEIWSGYWVYLERIEDIDAARTMRDNLHENGLTDAYIIPDSDSGPLISLGVFSEIIRASRVRERVRNLGYEATIADRVRQATVYWIDVDLPDGTLLDFDTLQPPGRIIRLEQRRCEDVRL